MRYTDKRITMKFQYVLPEKMVCDHPKMLNGHAGYGDVLACFTCKIWTWASFEEPEVSFWEKNKK